MAVPGTGTWYLLSTCTVVLELLTQWLNPLRELSAPSFTPQSESAAPLLALLYHRWYRWYSRIPSTAVVDLYSVSMYYVLRTTGTIQYGTVVRYSTVLANSGSQ